MSTPKFKERPHNKVGRLSLGKPHIYWSRMWGEWLYIEGLGKGPDKQVFRFCKAQDERWTPRVTT